MQTTGDEADDNDAAADINAATQTTDDDAYNDADNNAATQTMGNNEITSMTQPQTSTTRHRRQGDATTSRERGMGGHGATMWQLHYLRRRGMLNEGRRLKKTEETEV